MKRYTILFLFLFISTVVLNAQKKYTKEEYIAKFKPIALEQMKKSGVPASIILAQACLESGYGNSELTTKGKNHFGIKCHNSWSGAKMHHDDDAKGECFRVYKKDEESFEDHSNFLRYNKRYASLFDLDPNDYKAWAHGLKKAGYATNPKYAELLITTIESNKLNIYNKNVIIEVPSPSVLEAIDLDNFVIYLSRKIHNRNKVKYVKTTEEDTFDAVATEFKLRTRQLLKYNDLDKNDKIHAGMELYIKPKKTRADKHFPIHIVQEGDSMWAISQKYAVKLSCLYHYNNMQPTDEIEVGQELFLRNRMRK